MLFDWLKLFALFLRLSLNLSLCYRTASFCKAFFMLMSDFLRIRGSRDSSMSNLGITGGYIGRYNDGFPPPLGTG